jgi:hypothetical protein
MFKNRTGQYQVVTSTSSINRTKIPYINRICGLNLVTRVVNDINGTVYSELSSDCSRQATITTAKVADPKYVTLRFQGLNVHPFR